MLSSEFRPTGTHHSLWGSQSGLPVALGFSGRAATPASKREAQPFHDQTAGHVCVADIRLDNRNDLLAVLGLPASAGDCALAVAAYRRWGLAFPRHLLGAFAIALWDPSKQQLILSRDQMGVRSLIYAASKTTCLFGSAVDPVLRASPDRHPAQVDRLHCMLAGMEEFAVDTTAFEGILRVPAASIVTWRVGDGPRVHPAYWMLQEQEPLRLSSDEEYGEALHDVLSAAVDCRLLANAPVAVNLSGGIDSSIITAAACARDERPIRTYSAIADQPRPGSDTPHIHEMIREYEVDPVLLPEVSIGQLHQIDHILNDPDGFFDVEQGVQGATAAAMQQRGEAVLLSGIGGDDFFDIPVAEAALNQLGTNGLRSALGELRHWDTMKLSPNRWIRPIARHFLPRSITPRLRQQQRRSATVRKQLVRAGIDPFSAAGTRLEARWESYYSDPRWATPNARLNRGRRTYLTVALERYERLAARYGVDVRHPFLDLRVIEFALSLPPEQLHRNGWTKWILRNGTVIALPESIAWRPKSAGGMGEFWNATTAGWLPPHNVCDQSPDQRLFTTRELGSADELEHCEFLRYILKSWWLRHANLS